MAPVELGASHKPMQYSCRRDSCEPATSAGPECSLHVAFRVFMCRAGVIFRSSPVKFSSDSSRSLRAARRIRARSIRPLAPIPATRSPVARPRCQSQLRRLLGTERPPDSGGVDMGITRVRADSRSCAVSPAPVRSRSHESDDRVCRRSPRMRHAAADASARRDR